MKKINVEDAVGMTLCHDITAMRDGFKGAAFRRGHVITEDDIEELLNIGKKHVFVWEENAGEIHEDECALRMAKMTAFENASCGEPSEGKVVYKADVKGMFRVDVGLLHEIDSIDDITVSCIPDHYPVEPGARLASMRIVPLTTKEENIIKAEELCRDRALFRLLPYRFKKVGIVITGSEIYSGRIKDKFDPIARKKLEYYPCEILGTTICDDDLDMITGAIKSYLDQGAELIICSGGMSVDPDDLTPTAIVNAGAKIVTHGVPSQPGNMTLI